MTTYIFLSYLQLCCCCWRRILRNWFSISPDCLTAYHVSQIYCVIDSTFITITFTVDIFTKNNPIIWKKSHFCGPVSVVDYALVACFLFLEISHSPVCLLSSKQDIKCSSTFILPWIIIINLLQPSQTCLFFHFKEGFGRRGHIYSLRVSFYSLQI